VLQHLPRKDTRGINKVKIEGTAEIRTEATGGIGRPTITVVTTKDINIEAVS